MNEKKKRKRKNISTQVVKIQMIKLMILKAVLY